MKVKVKSTGEVFSVLDLDSERVLIKCDSEIKTFRLHEVDLIPESIEDYQKKEIDWEQRRYELAKEAMNGVLSTSIIEKFTPNPSFRDIAMFSVGLAEELIEVLKRE